MTHEVFTIVAAVRPGAVDRLKDLLRVIYKHPEANALVPFGKLPMLHFASFVVLHAPVQEDDDKPLPVLPDQLVFVCLGVDGPIVCDGMLLCPINSDLDDLVRLGGVELVD